MNDSSDDFLLVDTKKEFTASCNENVRTLSSKLNYEELEIEIKTVFGLNLSTEIIIQYRDDEDDIITLSSTVELQQAYQLRGSDLVLSILPKDSSIPLVVDTNIFVNNNNNGNNSNSNILTKNEEMNQTFASIQPITSKIQSRSPFSTNENLNNNLNNNNTNSTNYYFNTNNNNNNNNNNNSNLQNSSFILPNLPSPQNIQIAPEIIAKYQELQQLTQTIGNLQQEIIKLKFNVKNLSLEVKWIKEQRKFNPQHWAELTNKIQTLKQQILSIREEKNTKSNLLSQNKKIRKNTFKEYKLMCQFRLPIQNSVHAQQMIQSSLQSKFNNQF
eukprot:TRINITY_DN355_c0_g7_i3.p1 TRINITY_DN355_c0_g7~~TRINITY_DN355_c0_g7_i3.p1  ORF type:complete len:329 (-),score=163.73 TRINITY_DN355_c0_g7_i3:161-1147(-)